MKDHKADSHFIGHEPCPKCLSKDNLARYSDGHGYCFGRRGNAITSTSSSTP
jgi:twinkle protein